MHQDLPQDDALRTCFDKNFLRGLCLVTTKWELKRKGERRLKENTKRQKKFNRKTIKSLSNMPMKSGITCKNTLQKILKM